MRPTTLTLSTLFAVLVLAPAAHGQAGAPGPGGGASADAPMNAPSADPAPVVPAPATTGPVTGTTTSRRTNLRVSPGTGRVRFRVARGTRVTVHCQRVGPRAPGRFGPSRVWDRVSLANGKRAWLADGYLDTGTDQLVAPVCGVPARSSAPAAGTGPCPPGSPVTPLAAFSSAQELIAAALPGARASQKRFGVPVAVTLAQAILETGGGRLTAGANNFFGLKAQATATRGVYAFGTRAAGCVLNKTREAEGGGLVLTIGAFRAYRTLEDSILDHGERLATNPVYARAFRVAGDAKRFARAIARSYATDPAYAAKLTALIARYDLDRR